MEIRLEPKTQHLLKNILLNLRNSTEPPKSPTIRPPQIKTPPIEHPLTPETEKALKKIKKPSRSQKVSHQKQLSMETELLLGTVHKPARKARKKKDDILTTETEKALKKIKKPSRSQKVSHQKQLSTETELLLGTVHKPAKKARKKKDDILTTETEEKLATVREPSNHKDDLYKKIIYNIKVGVSYDDIAKLMSDNDVSWSDIKKYANTKMTTTTSSVATAAAAVASVTASVVATAAAATGSVAITAAAAAAAAVAAKNEIYANTPFTKIVLQLCMYTDKNVLDTLTYDVENILPLEILFVLLNSKTTINSSLYGACIKKVIPGLPNSRLEGYDLSNHLYKILNLSQMSNFPEIIMLLAKRIPYLEENAHQTFLGNSMKYFKACIWWSVPVYDLSGYLVAIRTLRFEKEKLGELATSTAFGVPNTAKGPAFKLVLAFENGWEAKVNSKFAVVAGATVLGMMLVANLNPIGASISAVATVWYFLGGLAEIQSLEEYERYKMICECLYRSGDERGVAPAIMAGYSCLNPREIKKEVIDMNLIIEEMQLEVEKLERWWQTAIRRPIDFEEEKGENIEGLQTVNEQGYDLDDASATMTMTAFNFMFGGNEETDDTKIKAAKSAQIIERLEETMRNLNILYVNLRYLDVRLRICSTYYNLEDCALDMKLVKDLMSKAINYNNILKRFNTMTIEKMKRSGKRKTRDTKIKRKENNTVAAAINRQTAALNKNTEAIDQEKAQIQRSITEQTTTLNRWQAKTSSAFTAAETTFKNNKIKTEEVRIDAAAAKAAAAAAQATADKAQNTAAAARAASCC